MKNLAVLITVLAVFAGFAGQGVVEAQCVADAAGSGTQCFTLFGTDAHSLRNCFCVNRENSTRALSQTSLSLSFMIDCSADFTSRSSQI